MFTSFMDDLSVFALSLAEEEHKLFLPPLHWTLMANGDADFHDNVIFFGFTEQQDDPVLVAKAPRLVENGWMLKVEYDRLVELWKCIGEEAGRYVPKPYGMTTLQQRPVLVISYIPGASLARLSNRSFWGNSKQVSALASEAARTLHALNRLTETPVERGGAQASRFLEKVETFRELFRLTSREEQVLADLVKRVESGMSAASHQILIQGDFWHGNMIRTRDGTRLMLVDWQFARWSADVSMDVYFFLLAGALSVTKKVFAGRRAKEAFRFLDRWRANIIPEYLSAYGKPNGYMLLPLKYGMLLCCVEKAVRSALEFGYSHPDDAVWRYLFAELMSWPDDL